MKATLTPNHRNKSFPARIPALFATYSVVGFDPAAQRVVDAVTMRLYASSPRGAVRGSRRPWGRRTAKGAAGHGPRRAA